LQPKDVLVLPFDLMDSTEKLQAVAKVADEAFGGAGIDFLIHNAGAQMRCGLHLLPALYICMRLGVPFEANHEMIQL
jgi:NAD(P)-dependent dehydrogenase (short-subunit alcohol dehydrogenase family)